MCVSGGMQARGVWSGCRKTMRTQACSSGGNSQAPMAPRRPLARRRAFGSDPSQHSLMLQRRERSGARARRHAEASRAAAQRVKLRGELRSKAGVEDSKRDGVAFPPLHRTQRSGVSVQADEWPHYAQRHTGSAAFVQAEGAPGTEQHEPGASTRTRAKSTARTTNGLPADWPPNGSDGRPCANICAGIMTPKSHYYMFMSPKSARYA